MAKHMENKNTRIVLAATFDDMPMANIARGMLEANGIPAILDNEIAYSVLRIELTPTNSIRLMVREQDLDKALHLLKEHGDI